MATKTIITFVLSLLISLSAFSQKTAYSGLDFGMTQKEVKKEFRQNKVVYQNAQFGGYIFRAYSQNFKYENGKLIYIRFEVKGSATFGTPDAEAQAIHSTLIEMLYQNGYTLSETNSNLSSYLEFRPNTVYVFFNKSKNKTVFIGTNKIYANTTHITLGIMEYIQEDYKNQL